MLACAASQKKLHLQTLYQGLSLAKTVLRVHISASKGQTPQYRKVTPVARPSFAFAFCWWVRFCLHTNPLPIPGGISGWKIMISVQSMLYEAPHKCAFRGTYRLSSEMWLRDWDLQPSKLFPTRESVLSRSIMHPPISQNRCRSHNSQTQSSLRKFLSVAGGPRAL